MFLMSCMCTYAIVYGCTCACESGHVCLCAFVSIFLCMYVFYVYICVLSVCVSMRICLLHVFFLVHYAHAGVCAGIKKLNKRAISFKVYVL